MKVALLKSRLAHPGGLERYTRRLAEAFRRAGCEVTLLTSGEAPDAVTVCQTSKWTLRHLSHFDAACKAWLTRHPHEIVFGMERNRWQTHYRAGSGVHAVYLKQRKPIDPWWKLHALNPQQRYLLHLEKAAFEHPDLQKLFTNSEMVREEILTHYKTHPSRIEVVHNGVDWHGLEAPFQDSLQGQNAQFEFLFVGHGFARKGLIPLLEALKRLPTRDWHLSVIGKERHLTKYAQWARRLPVSFYGPVDPLPYYQKADALVIPSLYDPFANVTLEGLAMGLTVLSSPYNGGKEVLEQEAIFPSLDPEAMTATLEWAMQRPKTAASAHTLRQSVAHLDFSSQLAKIVKKTCR